jgi:hypothetical protein
MKTPFGYVRPLAMISYWLDRQMWGLSPAGFHLTNLILIAAAAALVVSLIRRYTGDARLAGASGLLFALHPYHVENAAWIAARPDVLYSVLFMLAAAAYDRWRDAPAGLPVASLALFEAALLAKETAITLPVFLLVVGFCDRGRRPTRAEWVRGYVPMVVLALAHFLVVRPLALGGAGTGPLGGSGIGWMGNLLSFAAASILPAHTESLEGRPALWGAAALLAATALTLAARRRSGRIPAIAWAAAPAFVVLLGPSLISFQERYLFLPGAAAALALAALLKAAGRLPAVVATVLLVCGWGLSLGEHWIAWNEAGRASPRLIGGLVEASLHPEVREIVVANMPHRVHGAPVAADFGAAVVLSGGRSVVVRTASSIDYRTAREDAFDGPSSEAIRHPPPFVEVRLRVEDGRFSRFVRPVPPAGGDRLDRGWATVLFDGEGRYRVRIPPSPEGGRAACVWSAGRLERLF